MAGFVGPEIPGVTDGLIFYVDAALTYNSGSTTWYDKINGNNVTLTNGPTYSSDGYGSIVFDGTDDYATTPSFNEDSNLELSVFTWIKIDAHNTIYNGPLDYSWIINKRDNSSDRQWQLYLRRDTQISTDFYLSTSLFNGATTIGNVTNNDSPLNIIEEGIWMNVGFVTNGINGGYLKTYYNGELDCTGEPLIDDRGTGNRELVFAGAGWAYTRNDLNLQGRIATTQIYNRALTPEEVQQNYNALKGRFNL